MGVLSSLCNFTIPSVSIPAFSLGALPKLPTLQISIVPPDISLGIGLSFGLSLPVFNLGALPKIPTLDISVDLPDVTLGLGLSFSLKLPVFNLGALPRLPSLELPALTCPLD